MVLWIGVDDTDSLQGMCTTFLATEIVRDLSADFDLIGYPRLVRLNPNIPWKTRGNGAVCLRFGHGVGEPFRAALLEGEPIMAYPRAMGHLDPELITNRIETQMQRWCEFREPTTNPAYVVLERPPRPGLYWQAVRGVVSMREARDATSGLGLVRTYKNGRGLIGASAATAWRPRDRTYEILAYRKREFWGRPRVVDGSSVVAMDRAFPSTFNNYDFENHHAVITPHSPCPVLLGIRGDRREDLPAALEVIRGEAPSRWIMFETNQGTDDHISKDRRELSPYSSVSLQGRVSELPHVSAGGHVFFELEARHCLATVATFEPAKQFRQVIRALVPGDIVRVIGGVHARTTTVNLEKLQVVQLVSGLVKIANPRCPVCGKSMKSVGRQAGFRCSRGHAKAPWSAAIFATLERDLSPGWYEPPVCARRHISMPLKRRVPRAPRGSVKGPDVSPEGRGSSP